MSFTVAIAGLGAATRQIHLPAYAAIPDLRVVGGCDPRVAADAAFAGQRFGFPLFASAEEMLDKTRPDLLAVATPPETHFSLVKLGLVAGCHVICEKPFTESLDEAAELIELSRAARRWIVVNNQYRFMNIHQAAREQIGLPEFGELLFLEARQMFRRSESTEAGWRGRDPRRTCREFGTHVLDLCRFFFDEDPLAVTARMPRGTKSAGPDHLNLIHLEFSGDRMASITLDRLCRGRHRYLETRLDGSEGCIETRLGGGVSLSFGIRGGSRRPFAAFDASRGGRADLFRGERSQRLATDPLNVFAHATLRLVTEFLETLRSGGIPPCDAEDNYRTLALMLAAYESDRRRETIPMNYERRVGRSAA